MVAELRSCPACGEATGGRVERMHGRWVSACTRCGFALAVLRCTEPRCRRKLEAALRGPYARCTCGRLFRVRDGRPLPISALPTNVEAMPAPGLATDLPQVFTSDRVSFEELASGAREGSYRDRPRADVLQISRKERTIVIPTTVAPIARFILWAITIAPVILGLLVAAFDVGVGAMVLGAGLPLSIGMFNVLPLGDREKSRVRAGRVRIGADRIERGADGAWVSVLDTKKVRDVSRSRDANGLSQVRVVVDGADETPVLLDGLDEEEAVEVERRVRQHLKQLRPR